jgi:uncharacterized coiled-coil protein SlyX
MMDYDASKVKNPIAELEQRIAQLEKQISKFEDNLVLDQKICLTLTQKHNELIDLLTKKGIV